MLRVTCYILHLISCHSEERIYLGLWWKIIESSGARRGERAIFHFPMQQVHCSPATVIRIGDYYNNKSQIEEWNIECRLHLHSPHQMWVARGMGHKKNDTRSSVMWEPRPWSIGVLDQVPICPGAVMSFARSVISAPRNFARWVTLPLQRGCPIWCHSLLLTIDSRLVTANCWWLCLSEMSLKLDFFLLPNRSDSSAAQWNLIMSHFNVTSPSMTVAHREHFLSIWWTLREWITLKIPVYSVSCSNFVLFSRCIICQIDSCCSLLFVFRFNFLSLFPLPPSPFIASSSSSLVFSASFLLTPTLTLAKSLNAHFYWINTSHLTFKTHPPCYTCDSNYSFMSKSMHAFAFFTFSHSYSLSFPPSHASYTAN